LVFEASGLAADVTGFLSYVGFTLRSFVSFLFDSSDATVERGFDGTPVLGRQGILSLQRFDLTEQFGL